MISGLSLVSAANVTFFSLSHETFPPKPAPKMQFTKLTKLTTRKLSQLVHPTPSQNSGTVYGGIHTITLIPGDGIGLELSTSVKQIFKAASVPVLFEQFNITGHSTCTTLLEQAMASIRKNKVALKGILLLLRYYHWLT
jgi:hypothetical protein